jgi:hypothetical protein
VCACPLQLSPLCFDVELCGTVTSASDDDNGGGDGGDGANTTQPTPCAGCRVVVLQSPLSTPLIMSGRVSVTAWVRWLSGAVVPLAHEFVVYTQCWRRTAVGSMLSLPRTCPQVCLWEVDDGVVSQLTTRYVSSAVESASEVLQELQQSLTPLGCFSPSVRSPSYVRFAPRRAASALGVRVRAVGVGSVRIGVSATASRSEAAEDMMHLAMTSVHVHVVDSGALRRWRRREDDRVGGCGAGVGGGGAAAQRASAAVFGAVQPRWEERHSVVAVECATSPSAASSSSTHTLETVGDVSGSTRRCACALSRSARVGCTA